MSNLSTIPEELTKSIVIQRQLDRSDSRIFIKTGASNLVKAPSIERNAPNSPHVVRSHFQNYLKTQFPYEQPWVHPVSKVSYPHSSIKATITTYKYISPENYRALWALWTSSTNREALAGLFSYSPSTIKRRWDEGSDMILLMLIWPELNIKDLKIFPNA